jgi:hypothetical protein
MPRRCSKGFVSHAKQSGDRLRIQALLCIVLFLSYHQSSDAVDTTVSISAMVIYPWISTSAHAVDQLAELLRLFRGIVKRSPAIYIVLVEYYSYYKR